MGTKGSIDLVKSSVLRVLSGRYPCILRITVSHKCTVDLLLYIGKEMVCGETDVLFYIVLYYSLISYH